MEGLTKTGSANQSAREARRRCYRKHLPGLICQYPGHSENKSSWVPKTRGHPTSYAELTTAEREFTCDLGWCSRNSRSRRFLVLGEHFFSVFERMKVRLRSLDAPDSAMKLVLESKFPILRLLRSWRLFLTLHRAEEVLQFLEGFLGTFFLKEMAAIETVPRNR